MIALVPLRLPEGEFRAHFSARGLARLEWPGRRSRAARRVRPVPGGAQRGPAPQARRLRQWIARTRAALRQALAGRCPRGLPPLDLSAGTDFQRRVWSCLRRIAPGQTWSYGQLAARLGRPGAARAVGNACGANPIPVLIPCHRVVPRGGGLGGFSGPRAWKRRLLKREGAVWGPTGEGRRRARRVRP